MSEFPSIVLPGERRRRQLFFLSKSKLSRTAQLAAFMAGFGIRSVVNLQINDCPNPILLTVYVVVTSLLVATSSFVILVALWMLPLIKTAEEINGEIIHVLQHGPPSKIESFDLSEFAKGVHGSCNSPNPTRNIIGLKTFKTNAGTVRIIEVAWILAGTISVLLFMIDVIVVYWIKFEDFTFIGAVVSTVLLVSTILGLGMFGLYFRLYVVPKFRKVAKAIHPRRDRNHDNYKNVPQNNDTSPNSVKCTRDNSLTSDLPPEPPQMESDSDSFHGYRNNYYANVI